MRMYINLKRKRKSEPKGLEKFYDEEGENLNENRTLITDTHFNARNDNLAFNEYFYKFWEEIFFPYLDKHNIKTVIHLIASHGQT